MERTSARGSQRTTQSLPSLDLGSAQAQFERHGHEGSQHDSARVREPNGADLELFLLFGGLGIRGIRLLLVDAIEHVDATNQNRRSER